MPQYYMEYTKNQTTTTAKRDRHCTLNTLSTLRVTSMAIQGPTHIPVSRTTNSPQPPRMPTHSTKHILHALTDSATRTLLHTNTYENRTLLSAHVNNYTQICNISQMRPWAHVLPVKLQRLPYAHNRRTEPENEHHKLSAAPQLADTQYYHIQTTQFRLITLK